MANVESQAQSVELAQARSWTGFLFDAGRTHPKVEHRTALGAPKWRDLSDFLAVFFLAVYLPRSLINFGERAMSMQVDARMFDTLPVKAPEELAV